MERPDKKALIAEYKSRKIVGGVYSITNTVTGVRHIDSDVDIQGLENRLNFAKLTDSPYSMALSKEWKEFGAEVFELEILETIEKKETATDKEFKQEVAALLDIWLETQA